MRYTSVPSSFFSLHRIFVKLSSFDVRWSASVVVHFQSASQFHVRCLSASPASIHGLLGRSTILYTILSQTLRSILCFHFTSTACLPRPVCILTSLRPSEFRLLPVLPGINERGNKVFRSPFSQNDCWGYRALIICPLVYISLRAASAEFTCRVRLPDSLTSAYAIQ
jgi:hypothetical protein